MYYVASTNTTASRPRIARVQLQKTYHPLPISYCNLHAPQCPFLSVLFGTSCADLVPTPDRRPSPRSQLT